MDPVRFKRAREIFASVRELPAAERAALLDDSCAGDAEVRREVESLLAHHEEASGFLGGEALADPVHMVDGLGSSDQPHVPRHPDRIGHYKILGTLGQGGMGVVYLAEQTEPVRRRVALKVIKLGMDSREVVARFEVERQALALMDHAHIARLHDAGSIPEGGPGSGRPYFVMEFVSGQPITEYCDRYRLDLAERLKLFLQVCRAVGHAHLRGVIHRDLKPSNILVSRSDEGASMAKIIDFGIAKATGQQLTEKTLHTELGRAVGTPTYMSPEQAELTPEDIDGRTDIYSLGVVLYELIIGARPLDFEARPSPYPEVLRRIREEEPLTPSARWRQLSHETTTDLAGRRGMSSAVLVRELRGDLDWIIMKALEKDRERRYSTAAHLADDIERQLRGEVVLARPPNALYRWRKFVRKNRGRVAAAAAASIILALVTTAGWFAAKAQRDARALRERDYAPKIAAAVRKMQLGQLAGREARFRSGPEVSVRWDVHELLEEAGLSPVSAAVAEFDEAIASVPDRPDAYWYRARARQILGDHERARQDLERVLKIDPEFLPAMAVLADLLEESGESSDRKEAATWRGRSNALGREGWGRHWLAARNAATRYLWDEAAAAYAEAIVAGRDREPYVGWELQTRLQRAIALIAARSPVAALEEIAVVRYEWPDAVEAALLQGQAHTLRGLDGRVLAEHTFDTLFRETEYKDDVALAVASIYRHGPIRNLDRALAWIERVNNDGIRERFRSVVLYALGQPEEGLAAGRRAVEMLPQSAESYAALASSFTNFGRRKADWREAVKLLEKSLALEPDEIRYHVELGIAYALVDEKEKALGQCEEILGRDPPGMYYSGVATIYSRVGDLERAREFHDRAVQLAPGASFVHNNRGVFLNNLGEWQAAIEAFDRAIGINDSSAWSHGNKAGALEALAKEAEKAGDRQTATALFSRAIEEYGKATRSVPRSAENFTRLAKLLYERRDFQGAFRAALGALEIDVADRTAHSGLRRMVSEHGAGLAGQVRELRRQLQEAIDAGSTNADVIQTLALISE